MSDHEEVWDRVRTGTAWQNQPLAIAKGFNMRHTSLKCLSVQLHRLRHSALPCSTDPSGVMLAVVPDQQCAREASHTIQLQCSDARSARLVAAKGVTWQT
jgi:hypothetical protein